MKQGDKVGQIITNSVASFCAEREFYCFSLDIDDEKTGEKLDYDKIIFNEIDSNIAPIVKKILIQGSIDLLLENEKKELSKYVVYQYLRSPQAKNLANSLCSSERAARQIHGLALLDQDYMEQFSHIVYNLKLKLIKANEGEQFIISDSPVLWSPTAEGIHFPISPEYCLCYQKIDVLPLDPTFRSSEQKKRYFILDLSEI